MEKMKLSAIIEEAWEAGWTAARSAPSPTEKALAAFIAENFHHCPVDEFTPVPECNCWGGTGCPGCILKHATRLK